ncbi:hypothetical protein [Paraburkholderia sp. BCC1886]|uniref:hypothetical protein n=1 Tax=Paraburkholderia sp. BCC1886 TaxID=2562670 RepID=UPI001183C18B|nr:hypothetical protein [Paraburkholderia sp. BCC1886]
MTTSSTLSYPFDPTGSLASNLISGEQQQLVAQNFRDQHFIVPQFAPFFSDSLQITYQDTSGTVKTLVEGVDYYVTHWFISASRSCAMPVYGSISFIDTALAGLVSLNYQTVGGDWTVSASQIATILADTTDNPRVTAWEQVSGTPYAFPPEAHSWDITDLVGMSDVVTALGAIQSTLQTTGGAGLAAHEADHDNPHVVTAAQVGLGNVQNYAVAADSDGAMGTSSTLYMTPASTAAAIQTQVLGLIEGHIANYDNPHQTDADQVGLGNVQNYGVAADSDAASATSTTLYMTPATTAVTVNTLVGNTLSAHILDYDNPHETTADQVGLGLVRNLTTATNDDAAAGTSNDLYMTPATVMAAITSTGTAGALQAHITNYDNPHETTADQVGAFSQDEINTMLQGYVSTTGTAANSTLVYSLTQSELTSAILAGTANNAANFGGLTPAQWQTYLLGQTSANSTLFGDMSVDDWQTYIANATVANATQFNGMTASAWTAQIAGMTVANATTVGGLSVIALTTQILAGSAANANLAYGLTQAQLTTAILSGTANNATSLENLTVNQLQAQFITASNAQLWTAGTAAAQETVPASTDTTDATIWTALGKLNMPGSAQSQKNFPDVQWIVVGGEASTDTQSGAWLVRCSVRDTTQTNNVNLQVISLMGINTTTTVFGYTIDNSVANAPVLTIWTSAPGGTNPITVTSLSENSSEFQASIATVVAEPSGIVYSTADTFALASEMSNMLTQLTTAFTALANAVNGTSDGTSS